MSRPVTHPRRVPVRGTVNLRRLVSAAVLALTVVWASSVRGEETFTPQHVANLRSVSAAVIAPDGKSVAYVLNVPRKANKDDNGPPWTELHVVDDAGNTRPFVTGEVNVSAIAWTSDGRGISFLDKRGKDETKSLYVIPIDGGEARRVLKFDTDIQEYSWSPDGRRVVFVAEEKLSDAAKKLKDKGFNQEIYEEDFRPVRAFVATIGSEESKPSPLQLPGVPSDVVWSPAGNHVAFGSSPTPLVDDRMMQKKLHVYDVDAAALVSSFKNPGKMEKPVWSPDGERLAFLSAADINDPSAGRLLVGDPKTGGLSEPIPDFTGDFRAIQWQDNDTVMFITDEGVSTGFGEVRFDGKDRKTHVPPGKELLTSFTLSRDGQSAAMLASSPTYPSEVLLMRHGDAGARRLTESNPWLSSMRFAKQEAITYPARDGMKLDGLLIYPLDYEPPKRYPLILLVHGGPEAHYSNGWLTRYHSPGQVAAAKGFFVFHPNYRGSTGRGVEFSKLGQADAAGKEFDDLVDAVDFLIEKGLVEKSKVGVTGGSYGGYATAWCCTRYSDRFAAGVMAVGISNVISKAGTTDIPNEEELVHSRKRVWDDWDFFLRRSPIYHVEKAKTPLLILHGKDDPRVHPGQSLELFRHLKSLNQAPVRLVLYPGEGHGNRKIAGQLDYNIRMMQWFEHYLKSDQREVPGYDLDYGFEAPASPATP